MKGACPTCSHWSRKCQLATAASLTRKDGEPGDEASAQDWRSNHVEPGPDGLPVFYITPSEPCPGYIPDRRR